MSNLTEERIAEFREAFELFDKDQDGCITIDELATLMKALNLPATDQEIQNMKSEVDVDQNGNIEYKEYISLIARRVRDVDLEEEMIEAFKIFDTNNDGHLSKDELKVVMQIIGEKLVGEPISNEDLDIMWDEADTDQDGYIDYEEFCKVISNH
jgi:Ca2+-binding EF-hand superfamily protein